MRRPLLKPFLPLVQWWLPRTEVTMSDLLVINLSDDGIAPPAKRMCKALLPQAEHLLNDIVEHGRQIDGTLEKCRQIRRELAALKAEHDFDLAVVRAMQTTGVGSA